MANILGIIAGEPNSISSEIIFKTWKLRNKYNHKAFFIIGSVDLLNKQKKKLKYNIKIKKINNNFHLKKLNSNYLPIYNVDYDQKKPFQKISAKSSQYILKCFDVGINLIKQKKIHGLINCPIAKNYLFKNKHNGVTEFLSAKFNVKGKVAMLIYNKKLSVSPVTTHIPLCKVGHDLNQKKIVSHTKIINSFFKTQFKKKPIIGILGLNPHNYSSGKKSEEDKIIIPAIKILKKNKINVVGPVSTDTSFITYKKYKINVIVGMYHDQVLTAFKSLFGYHAINITLGLPFIRTSPDHGIAEDIAGMRIADPKSLIEAIKFFNYVK